METKQISGMVDSMVLEEDLPSRASLRPLKALNKFSYILHYDDGEWDIEELSDEDIQDRIEAQKEFINWFMGQEHLTLQSLPKPEEGDFWPVELDEFGNDISAFNTADFERLYPFDKYHWKVKRMCEKVRELAITHSCISDEEGRKRVKNRFLEFVRSDCKEKMMRFFEIWRQYAYWE